MGSFTEVWTCIQSGVNSTGVGRTVEGKVELLVYPVFPYLRKSVSLSMFLIFACLSWLDLRAGES